MNIKKTLGNNVAIELDGDNDHIITPGGVKLYIDNTFDPEKHTVVTGKVVALPEGLNFDKNKPNSSMPWETEMELQVGDQVIVYYLAVMNCMNKEEKKYFISDSGSRIIITSYKNIFCARRDGEIIPINGYCLIKPDEDQYYKDLEMRAAMSGLTISVPEIKNNVRVIYGKVKYAGKKNFQYSEGTYSDDHVDVNPGDRVVMRKISDIPVEYDIHQSLSEKYFRVQRRDIYAVLK